jgi:flagellar hook-length control protein FliK
VQIALDGSAAQVNLAAEQPVTRQLLEQAMPALAGALRESGLTLTGGGVFEQPREPRREGADPSLASRSSRPLGAESEPGASVAPATLRTLRGAVDLVA